MSGTRAAIRYAKAIMSLAKDQNATEVVNADMLHILSTIEGSDELKLVLRSSLVRPELKKASLLQIFPDLNAISAGLFDILIANKRLSILDDVARKYSMLYDELIGKEKATVTTAVPITNEMEIKVLAKIKELTNKAVELENIVDESILGGFILRIGDKQFNASIANQLNKLKRELILN